MPCEGQHGETYRDGMPEILDMPDGYMQRYHAEPGPDSVDTHGGADDSDREVQP